MFLLLFSSLSIITHIWPTIPFVCEPQHPDIIIKCTTLLPPPHDTHIAHRTFIARHKSKSYRIGWDSVDNRCAGRHFLQLIGLIRVSQGRVGVASSQGAHKVARDTRLTPPPPLRGKSRSKNRKYFGYCRATPFMGTAGAFDSLAPRATEGGKGGRKGSGQRGGRGDRGEYVTLSSGVRFCCSEIAWLSAAAAICN